MQVSVRVGGRVFQLLLFLLLASMLTTLPLLFQAIALWCLLLLKFRDIPLGLNSADFVGLSSGL